MKKLLAFILAAALSFGAAFTYAATAPAKDSTPPNVIVQQVVDYVINTVKSDPKMQTAGTDYVVNKLHDSLFPRFDFRRMTVLAMGRNWRQATREQQDRLVEQFKDLLIRTYARALTQFRDDKINVKPLRDATGKNVVVESEFLRKGQQPVPVDYSLILGNDGMWRCYDVVVAGVSLVTNFRDEFNQQVKAGGIEGLIKAIASKNAQIK